MIYDNRGVFSSLTQATMDSEYIYSSAVFTILTELY